MGRCNEEGDNDKMLLGNMDANEATFFSQEQKQNLIYTNKEDEN